MADRTLSVWIDGLDALRGKLAPEKVLGAIRAFLRRSAFHVEAEAKKRAPVDTGRLRGSIGSEFAPLWAVVGSKLAYAPHVEFGTRPHFPPPRALQPWAKRHGFPAGNAGAFLVARAIAWRGTKPQPYLLPAFNASMAAIQRYLDIATKAIERRWRA